LVAYCIDSYINEFFLKHLLFLFDDIFVDQLSSVKNLKKSGIRSYWLPLCVSKNTFRDSRPKDHQISFVGRVTKFRRKRQNLLKQIKRRYPLNHVQNVSVSEMQDIFASSMIVLNENLFDGLTLRIFQGLASGSVLLTEECSSVRQHFNSNHMVFYNHENIFRQVDSILGNPKGWANVAREGQALCWEKHTSLARAEEFIRVLENNGAYNSRRDFQKRKLAEANGRYVFAQRFGGSFKYPISIAKDLASKRGGSMAGACQLLGKIHARRMEFDRARKFLLQAMEKKDAFLPAIILALTFIQEGNVQAAKDVLFRGCKALPGKYANARKIITEACREQATFVDIYIILAKVYYEMDMVLDVGFLKQYKENIPESAYEFAQMAWEHRKSLLVLKTMISCVKKANLEYEIIDELLASIKMGVADDVTILYAAELAQKNFDPQLAANISKSFSRTLKKS
jgi:tetratricopeptide (TPR) repeat protein